MGNSSDQKPPATPAVKSESDKERADWKLTVLSDEDLQEVSGGSSNQPARNRLED